MLYRNTRTGLLVDFRCDVKGNLWEVVTNKSQPSVVIETSTDEPKPVKKTTKKK